MMTPDNWPRNRLLLALPSGQLKQLARELERVRCERGQVLIDVDEALDHIFFFDSGAVAVLTVYSDGRAVTVTAVGREGCSGAQAVLQGNTSTNRYLVYVPGTAARLRRGAFTRAMQTMPAFRRLMYGHVHAYLDQVMLAAACLSTHGLRQRLARWLLTLQDSSEDGTLALTHGQLASLLSVQRPSLTNAARELEEVGCIEGGVRKVTIVDRKALAKISCECYQLLKARIATYIPDAYR